MLINYIFFLAAVSFCFFYYREKKFRKKAESETDKYIALSKAAEDYIFEYNFEEDRLQVSGYFSEIFGCSQVINNYLRRLKTGENFFGETPAELENDLTQQEVELVANGQKAWFRSVRTFRYNEENKKTIIFGRYSSINREKADRKILVERSRKDILTCIYNRIGCEKEIRRYLLGMDESACSALFMVDIDYFKEINDNLGHLVGDEVLILFAKALNDKFGKNNIIGRWGGDEFIIFMKDIKGREKVEDQAGQLMSAVKSLVLKDGRILAITISAGIVLLYKKKEVSMRDIYQKADKALYYVKKNGRNGYEIYSDGD